MKKRVTKGIAGRATTKPYKQVRCPFCKHTFLPETIQIVGIAEERANFVILACPSARCRTILEIIPQYSAGINR
jgi:hypothetical protein